MILTIVWNGCVGRSGNTPDAPFDLAFWPWPHPEGVGRVGPQMAYGALGVRTSVGGVECDVFVLVRLDSAVAVLQAKLTRFYLIINLTTKQVMKARLTVISIIAFLYRSVWIKNKQNFNTQFPSSFTSLSYYRQIFFKWTCPFQYIYIERERIKSVTCLTSSYKGYPTVLVKADFLTNLLTYARQYLYVLFFKGAKEIIPCIYPRYLT